MIIPSGLITLYNDNIDSIISFAGINCTIVYPPKINECPNCYGKPLSGSSANKYKPGGPIPFTFGICPYCDGTNDILSEQTETVKMCVYWSPKEFLNVPIELDIPAGSIQTKCYLVDLPKIERAVEMRVANNSAYKIWTYERLSEPVPHGFGLNRYVLTLWKRK